MSFPRKNNNRNGDSIQHIVIVGGGISGLTLAHRLTELRRERNLALEITLLEASDRLGGVIQTYVRNGFLLEGGPDAFITEKPWAMDLCRRIGLGKDLIDTDPNHRRSFIVRKGRLVPVPQGFYMLAPGRTSTLLKMPLISIAGKLRMALEPWIPVQGSAVDESVASFIRRRFGKEALERLGQPMIGGIYAADLEKLSIQATFPGFVKMESDYGSVLRGIQARMKEQDGVAESSGPRYSLFATLRQGMQSLVDALVARMPDVRIRINDPVLRITHGPCVLSGKRACWHLHLNHQEALEADAIILATPAPRAGKLLGTVTPNLSRILSAIPYESVATVNAAFWREDVRHALNGFGFVAPHVEKRRMIGCTFSSIKFSGRAPHGMVLLRAFVGGALDRDILSLNDEALRVIVVDELRELLGISAMPRFTTVSRHQESMPQYHVGHLWHVSEMERALREYSGLYLIGNGYRGVGIPDCVREAELAAERIVQDVVTVGTLQPISI